MASSTLDPDGERPIAPKGHDIEALGPSDSTDSGSDVRGAVKQPFDVDDEIDMHALEEGPAESASDTDASGTGERASADGDGNFEADADILPDTVRSISDLDQVPDQDIADVAGVGELPDDDDDLEGEGIDGTDEDPDLEGRALDTPLDADVERRLRGLPKH